MSREVYDRRDSSTRSADRSTGGGVFVFTDVRVHLDSSGRLRAGHSAGAYEAWKPYLDAFGSITVVARCSSDREEDGPPADGPGVSVTGVPDYSGFRGFFVRLPSLARAMAALGDAESLFVGRLPEPLSVLAYARSRFSRSTYVAHVVAEPRGLGAAYQPGPIGMALGLLMSRGVRHIVAHCAGVVYVTERVLQSMYPPGSGIPSLSRSDAGLEPAAFCDRPLRRDGPACIRLISVGGLQGGVKGHDTLIRVVRQLHDRGVPAHLTIIGGGRTAVRLRSLASQLGVDGSVLLVGQVHHAREMRELLDRADIYVSASRSEGLPRATLEAMARSLPVVSTDVGGVQEIISSQYLVPIDATEQMAVIIGRLAASPSERCYAGSSNQARAREIAGSVSNELFVSFHEQFSR